MALPIEMQVGELITQSRQAPQGPTAIALAEEAVRLADTTRDVALGMMAREQLIEAATFGGQSQKAIVAFTWCMAQCDRQPEEFDETNFFWSFKWIADNLAEYPTIPREQIFRLIDDMAARYERHGYSLKPVHKTRIDTCVDMGELEGARHWLLKWQQTPEDWNNDCEACEVNSLGRFQLLLGDFDAAMSTFHPLLNTRRLRCSNVPHATYATVLGPLMARGRGEEADGYHAVGYPMVRSSPSFLPEAGLHMEFAAARGNTARGLKMFERHVGWLLHSGSPLEHLLFYLSARRLIGAAREKARGESRKLRLPKGLPLYRDDGEYAWVDLLAWIDGELNKLATAFDARNGNDHYTRRVAETRGQGPDA
jgi:hypothetical protein